MAATHSLVAVNQPELARPTAAQYSVAVGYLRAFITVLVVAHHAVLAYYPFALMPPHTLAGESRWWTAFPVIDTQRWMGWALFAGFNDIFFMALMFFLSGLFVWKSLQRKGSGAFLNDRSLRLGVPFLVAAAVIAPVAYYPAYLQTGATGIAGFRKQWLSLGNWPAGPAWFIWLLLVFDLLAALAFLASTRYGEAIDRLTSHASRQTFRFFILLVALSALAYVPLAVIFNPLRWTVFGPFFFQTSRVLHYLTYFLLGIGVGAHGLDRGLLDTAGNLAKRWWLWSLSAVFGFLLVTAIVVTSLSAPPSAQMKWSVLNACAFVLSCAVSSFAFLAVFARFSRSNRIWDNLSRNAYGIYLVHYAFVSWIQYALLKITVNAFVKGIAVTVVALALSWFTTAMLRRVPIVGRVI